MAQTNAKVIVVEIVVDESDDETVDGMIEEFVHAIALFERVETAWHVGTFDAIKDDEGHYDFVVTGVDDEPAFPWPVARKGS